MPGCVIPLMIVGVLGLIGNAHPAAADLLENPVLPDDQASSSYGIYRRLESFCLGTGRLANRGELRGAVLVMRP